MKEHEAGQRGSIVERFKGVARVGARRKCASESHMATGKSIGDSGDPDSPSKRSYP